MNYFIAFYCHWKTNASNIEGVTLVESRLKEVGSFGYKQGGTDTDVKVRMGKPRAAFLQLENIWNSIIPLWNQCFSTVQKFGGYVKIRYIPLSTAA